MHRPLFYQRFEREREGNDNLYRDNGEAIGQRKGNGNLHCLVRTVESTLLRNRSETEKKRVDNDEAPARLQPFMVECEPLLTNRFISYIHMRTAPADLPTTMKGCILPALQGLRRCQQFIFFLTLSTRAQAQASARTFFFLAEASAPMSGLDKAQTPMQWAPGAVWSVRPNEASPRLHRTLRRCLRLRPSSSHGGVRAQVAPRHAFPAMLYSLSFALPFTVVVPFKNRVIPILFSLDSVKLL